MRSERDFINRIRQGIAEDRLVEKGIGDDCAVFRLAAGESAGLISTDTLIEGVHFDLSWHPPKSLGHKAAAVNLSDIAGMGGVPLFALLSVAAPSATDAAWLDDFMAGFLAELRLHDVVLIGGDTVKSGAEISFGVTVVGRPSGEIIYRSGAKIDDLVWVSRCLGDAAAGLALCQRNEQLGNAEWAPLLTAHLQPLPEVELGKLLSASGLVHSMIDMSDGLATDLAQLCTESQVGARIVFHQIPISNEMNRAAEYLTVSPIDWLIAGGEDYCLLFTTPESVRNELEDMVAEKLGRELFCIGQVVAGSGVLLDEGGSLREVRFAGYDHFSD